MLTIERLFTGDRGARQTLAVIRGLIDQGKINPDIRDLAARLVGRYGARNPLAMAKVLLSFVRQLVRYVDDPVDAEFVQAPGELLRSRAGDCDDFVVLLGALLESVGIAVKLKVIAPAPGDDFQHVYLLAQLNGALVPLDPVAKGMPVGWEYPNPGRSFVF